MVTIGFVSNNARHWYIMRTLRITVFFVVAFASIVVPVVGGIVWGLTRAEPPFQFTRADVEHFADTSSGADAQSFRVPAVALPEWSTATLQLPEGARVQFLGYADQRSADAALRAIVDTLDVRSRVSSPGSVRYELRENGRNGHLFRWEGMLGWIEAPTDAMLRERTASLAFLSPNESGFAAWYDRGGPRRLAIAIGVYMLVLLFLWPRLASWAARIPAVPRSDAPRSDAPGSVADAMDQEELKRRLLAINALDSPLWVQGGKRSNELIVTWKYTDAKWTQLLQAGAIRNVASMRLRIDNRRRRVRSIDINMRLNWRANGLGVRFGAGFFRGISFAGYERGRAVGLVLQSGTLEVDQAYEFSFSQAELRTPVVEIITHAGWDFVPVVGFSPLWS